MAKIKPETTSEGIVNIIRGTTRPAITLWLLISWTMFLFGVYESGGTFADVPIPYTALTWGSVVWWFGDRSYFKAKGKIK